MTDLFTAAGVPAPAKPVEPPTAHFTHPCETCGDWGLYGVGVRLLLGQRGRWYCGEHRPGVAGNSRESAS